MVIVEIFTVVSNLLGVNLSELEALKLWIVIAQFFMITFGLYFSYFERISTFGKTAKDLYFIIDFIQVDYFFTLQVVIVARTFLKWSFQQRIADGVRQNLNTKSELSFIRNILVLVAVRIVKFLLVYQPIQYIFMAKDIFSELVLSSSDFMFQLYLTKLRRQLAEIRSITKRSKDDQTIEKIQKKVRESLSLLRDLKQRYSIDLFLSVTFNFMQLIICFYFVFIRLSFNYLRSLDGELILEISSCCKKNI